MTTKEFIGYFKMANDKQTECKKRIIKNYIPFTSKIAECCRVVKATMEHTDENQVVIYKQNTPMRFLIFNMSLLGLYTDLEFSENLIDEYDLLNEYGAIDILITCIPEHEFKEFSTLLSMTVDDYMSNERELTAYIDKKIDLLTQLALLQQIEKTETGE